MANRLDKELDPAVPMSLIYGENSWMFKLSEAEIHELRPNSYVKVHEIPKAGHHIHADQPESFNDTVNSILEMVDQNKDERNSL